MIYEADALSTCRKYWDFSFACISSCVPVNFQVGCPTWSSPEGYSLYIPKPRWRQQTSVGFHRVCSDPIQAVELTRPECHLLTDEHQLRHGDDLPGFCQHHSWGDEASLGPHQRPRGSHPHQLRWPTDRLDADRGKLSTESG